MGKTKYFGLAFFDFGDPLDSVLSVNKEIDRFVLIDRQLYGLYSIFGNGVIEGWNISNSTSSQQGISVSINGGIGIINYYACQTTSPKILTNLPSNRVIYIIAKTSGSTSLNRNVIFTYTDDISSGYIGIVLSRIVTGTSDIISIDNSVRDGISFEDLIDSKIASHKHRGTPSKIDLQSEVKNQIAGARIDSLDVDKIVGGTIDKERLPVLDHNDLLHNGTLSHANIDSFVSTLSDVNKGLLGEISSVNLIKTITYLKYLYPEIDYNFINELIFIPGISSDDFVDYIATSAIVDISEGYIAGVPTSRGFYSDVLWDSQYALSQYSSKFRLNVSDGQIKLSKGDETRDLIDNSAFISSISSEHDSSVSQETGDSNKIEGSSSDAFSSRISESMVVFVKDLKDVNSGLGQNWTAEQYDSFVLWIKSTSLENPPVDLRFIVESANGEESIVGPFRLLDPNTPTEGVELSDNNFEQREILLDGLDLSNVVRIEIYHEISKLNSDFIFYMDYIHLKKGALYYSAGYIKYRYSVQSPVIFYSLFYNGDLVIPDETTVQVRYKIASSEEGLNNVSYSNAISSGQVINASGTHIELQIDLSTNDLSISPTIDDFSIRMLTDGTSSGFEIDTASDFDKGIFSNLSYADSINTEIEISDPINVNGIYYSYRGTVQEMDDTQRPLYGISGGNLPISPLLSSKFEDDSFNDYYNGFNDAVCVFRGNDKTFCISDNMNDRVVVIDGEQNLIRGIGSSNLIDNSTFTLLSAVYNDVRHILYLVFTQTVDIEDVTKIGIVIGQNTIYFSDKDALSIEQLSSGRVVIINLSDDTWVSINSFLHLENTVKKVVLNSGALSKSISSNLGTYKRPDTLGRWDCFVGNFSYVDGIQHPVYGVYEDSKYFIFNARVQYDNVLGTSMLGSQQIPSIIEFDEDLSISYSSNLITFSDYTLSGMVKIDDNRFLVTGLQPGNSISTNFKVSDLLSTIDEPTRRQRKSANAVVALANYRGYVGLIDRLNNIYTNFYIAPDGNFPTDIDQTADGNYLISESAFYSPSGRVVKLDSYGNVTYVYGYGSFASINSIQSLRNDNFLIGL